MMGHTTPLEFLFFTNYWTSDILEDVAFDCAVVPLTTHVSQFQHVKSVVALPGCNTTRFYDAMNTNDIFPPMSPTLIEVSGTSKVLVISFETSRILTRIKEQKCFVVEFSAQRCSRRKAPVVERVEF